jgi:hypothetical protein
MLQDAKAKYLGGTRCRKRKIIDIGPKETDVFVVAVVALVGLDRAGKVER